MRTEWTDVENWKSILPNYNYAVQEFCTDIITQVTMFSNLKNLLIQDWSIIGEVIFTTYPHKYVKMQRFWSVPNAITKWFLYKDEDEMLKDYFDILLKGKNVFK